MRALCRGQSAVCGQKCMDSDVLQFHHYSCIFINSPIGTKETRVYWRSSYDTEPVMINAEVVVRTMWKNMLINDYTCDYYKNYQIYLNSRIFVSILRLHMILFPVLFLYKVFCLSYLFTYLYYLYRSVLLSWS